jgi:hypothetical protein
VTIDGPSGGYDDDPQQGADSKPEKAHEHGRKGADILDVARAPDDPPVFQANHRWRVHGQRDDVGITAIVQPDGRIWSAWPDAGSPGVVKNPKEAK